MVTAGFDPSHDEGVAPADRLSDTGVAATRLDDPGLVHGITPFGGAIPAAGAAHRDVVAALRTAFGIRTLIESTT